VLDLVLTRGELAIDASARFHPVLPTDPAFLHADLGHDRGDALDRAKRRKWVDADRRRSLSIEIIGRRDTDRDHCARPIPDPFTDGADRRVFSSHRRPGLALGATTPPGPTMATVRGPHADFLAGPATFHALLAGVQYRPGVTPARRARAAKRN
jgi:hypothetical protein